MRGVPSDYSVIVCYNLHEIYFKIHAMNQTNKQSQTPATELAIDKVRRALRAGHVYRREDFVGMSNAVDRHLSELVADGALTRLAQGLYYAPRQSAFGIVPAADQKLVNAFLRDKDFLIFSPSSYNSLGLGTTQLYNKTFVYNHKRHGVFSFENRSFDFRIKLRFPKKLTSEFLLIDAINNLAELAEDQNQVCQMAQRKLIEFNPAKLNQALAAYGSIATKKRFTKWLNDYNNRTGN
jgi:hypothetical protein